MSQLEQALLAVVRFLEEYRVPYMVIGGIANVIWGIPRTTLDVDLTVWVQEEKLQEFVKQVTQAFTSRTANPFPFVEKYRVLPIQTGDGVRVDIIFGQLPYEEEAIQRAESQTIQGIEVRFCRPEDLLLHKLVSERQKDKEDVRGIIQQQRDRLDRKYLDPRVISLARELDRPDIQSWYMQCLREAGKARVP